MLLSLPPVKPNFVYLESENAVYCIYCVLFVTDCSLKHWHQINKKNKIEMNAMKKKTAEGVISRFDVLHSTIICHYTMPWKLYKGKCAVIFYAYFVQQNINEIK